MGCLVAGSGSVGGYRGSRREAVQSDGSVNPPGPDGGQAEDAGGRGEAGGDRSNVSRLLDRVTRRGLAHRAADTRDGRVAVLELSPGGQAVVNTFEKDLAARLGHLIAGWPARKRQAAASALAALIDAIQRDMAEEDGADRDPGASAVLHP